VIAIQAEAITLWDIADTSGAAAIGGHLQD
jgi:hypothetical protein